MWSPRRPFGPFLFLLLSSSLSLYAQPARLTRPIQDLRRTTLPGQRHPLAQPRADRGRLADDTTLSGVTLLLKPTEQQQAELDALLAAQHDPQSPDYRRWLTPAQYADRFSASAGDLAKIQDWLQQQGLSVEAVAEARNWIAVRGSAGQFAAAFRTELHRFDVNGRRHYAPANDLTLPGDLADLVSGVIGLDDFQPAPQHQRHALLTPEYTTGSTSYLAPDDLATIYNLTPLYQAGYDGTGQKLVVAGRTAINIDDMRKFRARYNLPANDPQVILFGTDPGVSAEDQTEANLDLQWAGAIARNATIFYVYSANILNSVQYAIDKNLAPVISFSYGACEQVQPSSVSSVVQAMAKQANAQGITWVAASGDSGAAGCDSSSATSATKGLGAGFPASVPEITAVGGTQFDEGSGKYWGANAANSNSALSYIPERAWNESAKSGLWASGGGLSKFFAKPTWQTGPGIPADNARAIPDLSFAGAASHDGYLFIYSGQLGVVGGTSAATPVFAGMLAVLNHSLVKRGLQSQAGLGNVNTALYRIAQSTTGVFHDITVGDNKVPCATGSPNCVSGRVGYAAGSGYDLATGLGSLDAAAFVAQWSNKAVATATKLTADPATTLPFGNSVTITVTITPTSGTGSPTGTVALTAGSLAVGAGTVTKGTAVFTVAANQLSVGANTLTATYSGGTNFSGSSATLTVTVAAPVTNSAVTLTVNPNPVYQQAPDANGNAWMFAVKLTETGGGATTLTSLSIDGTDYTSSLTTLFGGTTLASKGSLTANMAVKGITVPANRVIKVTGKDASSRTWSQQLTVPFYGLPKTAKATLVSVPAALQQNPASTDCPWAQELHLQESGGYAVDLKTLKLGGTDYTKQIATVFSTTRLMPYGDLAARLCWKGLKPPSTLDFETTGTDTNGNSLTAKLTVAVQAAPAAKTTLAVSQPTINLSAVAGATLPVTGSLKVTATGASPAWTALAITPGQATPWLTLTTGAGVVNLSANLTGLVAGVYRGSIIIQSPNAVPQWISVPVTLTVSAGINATARSTR